MPTNNPRIDSPESSKSPTGSTASERDEVIARLAAFYAVMGKPPEADGALAAMAEVLCAKASVGQIRSTILQFAEPCQ